MLWLDRPRDIFGPMKRRMSEPCGVASNLKARIGLWPTSVGGTLDAASCEKYKAMTTTTLMPPTIPSVADDPRWARIVARDKTADGNLWYSVATTGVYCRPSCPSRAANPDNVRLHDSLESARATGFRPCRRCNPDGPSIESENAALVAKACRIIEESDEEPSLKELADAIGRSPSYFHRVFKAATGLTPKGYASADRAKKVREGLASGNTVTATIYDAGFGSSGRFYEKSTGMLGMTPSHYRAGGANEEIKFAVGQTSLGAILVASSKKGVASILLGDDPEALVRNLQDRFPKARLIGADRNYETLVARVVGFIETPGVGLNLPLDVRGTVFQQRVWQALQEVPVGDTISYAEIARRIGSPKAVRAVAGACAANNLAVAIPCHRVVRNDGSLSGYAWGVERKRVLLDREASQGTLTASTPSSVSSDAPSEPRHPLR
jgi:AraC family transcriptional regulator of adaptative response/methylated-DNA-[protein]-cysteine methyltransferase